MGDVSSQNQEQQVKKLKRLLEGWRVALLPLKSIILWEEQWHPCAIVGSLTFLYLVIWLLDLNSLATFAVLGLILNLIDFIVPTVCTALYGQSTWTGQKEKAFEEICKSIVVNYNIVMYKFRSFYSLRDSSPYMYYVFTIGILCAIAWVASSINNIFLLYILSVVMLLWPGIRHRGILNTVLSLVTTPKTVKAE